MRKQSGFTIIEAAIIIVIIGVIGAVGYTAYTNLIAPKTTDTAAVTSPSPSPSVAPTKVTSSSDLDSVSSQLDSIPVDDSDNSTLDTASNSF